MNSPFWIGQAVVVRDHPIVRKWNPGYIGQIFTVASGLQPYHYQEDWPGRMVYRMQETGSHGGPPFFAPDEIRPFRDPSADLAVTRLEEITA